MAAVSENESSLPKTIIPDEWSDAAEAIAYDAVAFPIILVCGPKNSGKTTFSRHIVNVLLQRHKRVPYLDTDVGQTEFTPPGLPSLTVIDKIPPGKQNEYENDFSLVISLRKGTQPSI
ncbi:polynucleotide 5'-hydroxyl-kinase NOL9 [Striga asiatica]|uniref:Polynucleotide 5'-hydroxyl-kinase NOL9 n=1 Tax=Striga asiatica TaxID=4170 RepID=A0A5A7P3K6_STRAF|nr:polynucleotide 5'-hydroxyl-kinase NOL9 [Striga asiatica]